MTVRVGVIGVGAMGRSHARVYAALMGAELVGVVDRDAAAARAVAEATGSRSFGTAAELLAAVDAVSIAVPTDAHLAVTLEAVAAGVHVLVEKPIAATIAAAEHMVQAAAERQVILQVGHIERYNPSVTAVAELLKGQRILSIDARRLSPPAPRIQDVDVVFDLMIHDLDVVIALVGAEVTSVQAIGRRRNGRFEHVTAQARGPGDEILRFAAGWTSQRKVRRLEVTTETTDYAVDYMAQEIEMYRRGTVADGAGRIDVVQHALVERAHVRPAEPLALELDHFLSCVRSGAEPLTSGHRSLAPLALADAVEQAALQ